MSSDDAFNYDDNEGGDDSPGIGAGGDSPAGGGFREWMNAKRGWLVIGALGVVQAIFAVILIVLRSGATPVEDVRAGVVRDLAVEMLGREVAIKQIYQLVRAPGGKRMTIGLDVVLVLGQLPEERIDGAPRPTPAEFDVFIAAIGEMEPRVRSEVNLMLQRIPIREYGTADVYKVIKDGIRDYINDSLERLDFGKSVRPGIGKRRVTEVLLPSFVRQAF